MIVEAKIENAYDIARIHVCTWQAAYKGIMPETYLENLSIDKRQKRWESLLQDSKRNTLITTNEAGELVGWSSCGLSRDKDVSGVAELYAIYIHPDYWGKGFGRELMIASETLMKSLGFSKITLWVLKKNSRTRHFYKKAGYLCDGTEKQIEIGGLSLEGQRYVKSI